MGWAGQLLGRVRDNLNGPLPQLQKIKIVPETAYTLTKLAIKLWNRTIIYPIFLFLLQTFCFCHKLSVSAPVFLFLSLNSDDIVQKHVRYFKICPAKYKFSISFLWPWQEICIATWEKAAKTGRGIFCCVKTIFCLNGKVMTTFRPDFPFQNCWRKKHNNTAKIQKHLNSLSTLSNLSEGPNNFKICVF